MPSNWLTLPECNWITSWATCWKLTWPASAAPSTWSSWKGGVLHYFHDIAQFMGLMHRLLRPGGRMICSDFHPFTKMQDTLGLETRQMSYFCADVFEGEMAHARFYPADVRAQFPKCRLRRYTMSEIVNASIDAGFTLRRLDEHPAWENPDVPGEFTIVADRI